MTGIIRFEVGNRYRVPLMNEDDGTCEVTILSRTEKTVTTDQKRKSVLRVRIWEPRYPDDDGISREVINPLGRYSMAPVITAADLADT